MSAIRTLAVILMLWAGAGAKATVPPAYPLLPVPQEAEFGRSMVSVKTAAVEMPCREDDWCRWLSSAGIRPDSESKYKITGEITDAIPGVPEGNTEAYSLTVSRKGIKVCAVSEQGIYWALQTLRQLSASCEKGRLPECAIVDFPAFPWRGFMMDTGRSYISLDELKREIDVMSQFKMNIFHWHLTENQAWRLESRIFPMLNDSINMERQPGQFYTLEQAKELVAYAKERNVTVVPEIDMPGHSAAFVRTFRHDMQSPEGMKILKLIIDEVCGVFDVPYIHIGTDEVAFTNPDFVPEMVKFVRDHGKKVISWNPGWKYREGEIDMITMWSYRGRPVEGVPAVDLRLHYINHFDTYADLVALYRSNIYGRKKAEDGIAGVEIALWNDRLIEDEASLIAQNSVYPAMLAIAERSWCGGGDEYFDKLGTNLNEENREDFAAFADFENRLLWHKENTLGALHIPYVRQTNVRWRITDAFPNGGDLTKVFPPETEGLREAYEYEGGTYGTGTANGAGIYLRHVWGATVPGFYAEPEPNHTAYAFTWVYSPKDQTVGLQAETQNYSRSESDIAPPAGEWDFRHSRIWINDNEIPAPVWTSDHTVRSNEIPLGNENFAARGPAQVQLHAGWNKVLIKLPVGEFRTGEVRLVKWMFSFVFTTPDGRSAAPGLVYSPSRTL